MSPEGADGPAARGVGEATGAPAGEVPPAAPPDRRPARHRRRRRVRRRRIVVTTLGVLLLALVGFLAWYELQANPLGGRGAPVAVEVSRGEPAGSVVEELAQKGVISSTFAFRLSDLVHGTPSVLPGGYLLHQNSSFSTVRAVLAGGPNIEVVTVRPGLTLREVAEEVGQLPGYDGAQFLAVARSGAVRSPWEPAGTENLEGLLGADTYQVVPGESDTRLLSAMVADFNRQALAAGLTPAAAASLGVTPYQVITAASVVEKEGYILKNMPQVARVIYNRLARGTPLQMNSTVLYSLGQDGGSVTPADLALNTPYNTYLHVGLPPTPICIPSQSALEAAVHPPPGAWLFFVVVDKDGTEAFSDTYAGQLANEKLAASRGVG